MIARDAIAGVVLAGGRSTRMGGADKALLEIDGRTLIHRVVTRLQPQVPTLAINSNALDLFKAFPVIADDPAGYLGPLAGILTGLQWSATQGATHVATIACDTPFFPVDMVERFARYADGNDIVLASSRNRTHPVIGLWPVALAPDLRAFLSSSETLSVMAFVSGHRHHVVDFSGKASEPDPFFNVNTPDDLAAATKFARQSHS